MYFFSLQASYQNHKMELFFANVNYRFQCFFNTDYNFINAVDSDTVTLHLLPGFFFTFPTDGNLFTRKSITNYDIENTSFGKFKEKYNLNGLQTSFLITGGIQSMQSFDPISSEFLDTTDDLEDTSIIAICNKSSSKSVNLKINFNNLAPRRIMNLRSYVFGMGYSKQINSKPFSFKNETFVLPRPVSQSCHDTNKKMVVQCLKYLLKYISSSELIKKMGLRTSSIYKTEDQFTEEKIEQPSDFDLHSYEYFDEDLLAGRITDMDIQNIFSEMITNGEYLKKSNIQKIVEEDQKWLKSHNPRQGIILTDNKCSIIYKEPPHIPLKNFTPKNIFHFLSLTVKVPESCEFLINYKNNDLVQCEQVNHLTYVVKEIPTLFKNGVISVEPFTEVLRNTTIQYPLFLKIQNNVIRKNFFTNNTNLSVLAVIQKTYNGVLSPSETHSLIFNRNLNQFLFFEIVDNSGKRVYINPNSYFSVQISIV